MRGVWWWIPLSLAAAAERPEFVRIPAGSFEMGCPPDWRCSETVPKKRVEFTKPFEIMRTEVTVDQYRRFVKATGYVTMAEQAGEKKNWRSPGFPLKGNQPVVWMSLPDAQAYCKWIGARVPYDSEWEYAARAGTTTWHYWGEEIDGRYLWYRENSGGRPRKVGTKLPNAWGLHDMEGNALEWVAPGPPYTSILKEGHGSLRGGSWILCPEPYAPDKGKRSRQIGLWFPFPNYHTQHFEGKWRRDDGGFRCARSE